MRSVSEIESEFVFRIDCRFPYADLMAAQELILEASRISDNAILQVVWEILRPPAGVELHEACREELFKEIRPFSTKCVLGIVDAVDRAVHGRHLSLDDAKNILGTVLVECRNCYNAIGIIGSIVEEADSPEVDRIGRIIIQHWTDS